MSESKLLIAPCLEYLQKPGPLSNRCAEDWLYADLEVTSFFGTRLIHLCSSGISFPSSGSGS